MKKKAKLKRLKKEELGLRKLFKAYDAEHIEMNYEKAHKLYLEAWEKYSCVVALNYLACLNTSGNIEVNEEKAIKYWELGVKKGCPVSMFNLGQYIFLISEKYHDPVNGSILLELSAGKEYLPAIELIEELKADDMWFMKKL